MKFHIFELSYLPVIFLLVKIKRFFSCEDMVFYYISKLVRAL